MDKIVYLGDSVYAERLYYGIAVFLNNGEKDIAGGIRRKGVIFMEPQVMDALVKFIDQPEPEQTESEPVTLPLLTMLDKDIDERKMHKKMTLKLLHLLSGFSGRADFTLFSTTFDFECYTHAARVALMQHLAGGEWEKDVRADSINYVNRTILPEPYLIRFWAGAPPPSCRVVEEEVEVPEKIETKVTPAHTEKRRRIVCDDNKPETVTNTENETSQPTPAA